LFGADVDASVALVWSVPIVRVAAGVEYDGSGFSGWQLQVGVRTIQGCVEKALSAVADEPIRVVAAGRTDAGVHACGQVIHFETTRSRSEYSWVRGATSNLPDEVALLWAKIVDDHFHARFTATERHYRYLILDRRIRPTYLAKRVTWEYRELEVARMQQATQYLIGIHDFSAFRAMSCQAKSPIRDLRRLDVRRRGRLVCIEAAADGFLHHMVRNLAGVLMTIGAGERRVEWAREVLETRDRALGGITAPAAGLYLVGIQYPEEFCIPRPPLECGI